MKKMKYVKSALLLLMCVVIFTSSNICTDKATAQPVTYTKNQVSTVSVTKYKTVSSLDLVNTPRQYLNQTVVINAKFDKFSTLGLDYKPAFKSSEDYISFLIKRDDTTFDIPLSEMKLFIKRTEAEKFIDLKTNDEIQITGTVFSDALGDVWIDVSNIILVKKAPDNKDGVK